MKATILKEFENSELASMYPVKAGKTYDTDKPNCPINEQQMTILSMMGYAKDNEDMSQWKDATYEEKRYKKDCAVFRNNCGYMANQKTSKIWVRSEWNLVSGVEEYIIGQAYLQGNEIYFKGAIWKAKIDTSNYWIQEEWDMKVQGAQ